VLLAKSLKQTVALVVLLRMVRSELFMDLGVSTEHLSCEVAEQAQGDKKPLFDKERAIGKSFTGKQMNSWCSAHPKPKKPKEP